MAACMIRTQPMNGIHAMKEMLCARLLKIWREPSTGLITTSAARPNYSSCLKRNTPPHRFATALVPEQFERSR